MAEWWLGPTTSDQCGQNPVHQWCTCATTYPLRVSSHTVIEIALTMVTDVEATCNCSIWISVGQLVLHLLEAQRASAMADQEGGGSILVSQTLIISLKQVLLSLPLFDLICSSCPFSIPSNIPMPSHLSAALVQSSFRRSFSLGLTGIPGGDQDNLL